MREGIKEVVTAWCSIRFKTEFCGRIVRPCTVMKVKFEIFLASLAVAVYDEETDGIQANAVQSIDFRGPSLQSSNPFSLA